MMREGTARNSWSGTARAPTAHQSISKKSRLGAVGSGPNRLGSSKLKPKLRQIEPKKPNVTGDVTAAWNAEPKKRKSNNLATSNADPVDGQASKRTYKLSVQNRIYKSRRDGRAPDPSRLVFIDPKTGKAPTTIPAPTATAMPSKTPLQLHREELAKKEAEERQTREVEETMIVDASDTGPPLQSIDQDREIRDDRQDLPETDKSLLNVSASPLKPAAGDMTDGPAYVHNHKPHPSAPPHLETSENGPAIETKRMATMSLQDYTKRSISLTPALNEAALNSNRFY